MSKAFTKEDDDGGFAPPPSSSLGLPGGPFRLTATGARALARTADPRIKSALALADVLAPRTGSPEVAALGVTVCVRTEGGDQRRYRLVTPEERALVGDGVSVASPLGRALLGAHVGDVRESRAPRGNEELTVVSLEGEAPA